MSDWEELLAAALLGTARREPHVSAPLAVAGASAEERLLAGAAVATVYRRAGRRPRPAPQPFPPAPAESAPRCSDRASAQLAALLAGDHPGLLDEWLDLAAARGLRVPEELLPGLLAAGRGREARVLAVAGERGCWLAGLNDDWSWAAAGDVAWRTGALEVRRAWLATLRRARPGNARAALEAGWRQEDPRARAVLLAVLEDRLSPDDEPFLEAALDDRRQEVRAVAADLLARLPGSALARRSAERARPLLRRRRLPAGLEARLPDALDAAAARDMVHTAPPRGTGERAWWLRQLVAATPLATWERELGGTPDELAGLPVGEGLGEAVHRGWAGAALRQRSAAWAEALLRHGADPALLDALPRDRAERYAVSELRRGAGATALRGLRPPWGLELSLGVVARLPLTRELALAVDPRVLDALPDDAPPAAVRLLAFRLHMHEELA